MAYIDCLVDTHPMANEINSVSTNIKGTTAAVVGMKAAVIQAEAEAADHVCNNVNKGFYTLIHSQISQKIAKLQSEVDSHLMKLNQLCKQLLSIKGRMERDYGNISQRYIKLFNGLNKNLEQRVYEIDRPAIEFAVKDSNSISNSHNIGNVSGQNYIGGIVGQQPLVYCGFQRMVERGVDAVYSGRR